jgi:UDPglucose--hexose-1-phosphate uridylyltransferase
LAYARHHLDLADDDLIYARNRLLEALGLDVYEPSPIDEETIKAMKVPDSLLEELRDYVLINKRLSPIEAERLAGSIIGRLTPLPSQINRRFWSLYEKNPRQATDYLYDLQIKNDYIKKTFVDTNIHWVARYPDNFLEITINMSKPEKNNADIAKLVKAAATGYPKCVLCEDNLGYYGRDGHANRSNIRTINLTLDGEDWFFQYSPYVYYDRHCIVIDKIHRPMEVSDRTIRKLLAFVEQFPHFFIGSNSDLPLVGGSILNHEHFQGGAHLMPMMHAKPGKEIKLKNADGVSCHILDWYNTAFIFESAHQDHLLAAIDRLITAWRIYDDASLDILSHTDVQHNTATILARYHEGRYLVYVILRNNRKSAAYPEGIFHAHPEYHHIKSEGIGLIEAGGIFILPARLKRQLHLIETGLKDNRTVDEIIKASPDLAIHRTMIERLKTHPGPDVKLQITQYVNDTCRAILDNTAVFKFDEAGRAGLTRFLAKVI